MNSGTLQSQRRTEKAGEFFKAHCFKWKSYFDSFPAGPAELLLGFLLFYFSNRIPATGIVSLFSFIILVIMLRRRENYSITPASLPLTDIITSLSEGKAKGCFCLSCDIVSSLAAGHVNINERSLLGVRRRRWAKLCPFCLWPPAGLVGEGQKRKTFMCIHIWRFYNLKTRKKQSKHILQRVPGRDARRETTLIIEWTLVQWSPLSGCLWLFDSGRLMFSSETLRLRVLWSSV